MHSRLRAAVPRHGPSRLRATSKLPSQRQWQGQRERQGPGICSAIRDETAAERDTAGARPGAAAATSGEFGKNGATSSADDLIGEDGVKVEALAKGWDALPGRYQMVVSASEWSPPLIGRMKSPDRR